MSQEEFDVVVIGAGPGGYVAAIRSAQLGLKTACIESRGALGGTCLNVGCVPSKSMLESSEMYVKIQHASEFGINVSKATADIPAILKRKDDTVSQFTRGITGLFKKNKITSYDGFGSITGKNSVRIKGNDGNEYNIGAKHIIIATGSAPIEIPIAKFDGNVIVDSTDALSFDKVPKHLVVIGGGVIGLEMGSVWSRLGAEVTVIEALPEITYSMDGTIRKTLRRVLQKQGFKFHTNTKVTAVTATKTQGKVIAQGPDGEIEIKADKVLVAVGRKPYTENLGLESVGIRLDERGRVAVNDHLQTTVPNIYAIGDVIVGPMLAHKAEEEGVAVAERIAGLPGHVNYEAIPSVIYTWPEVASVGKTEEELKEAGVDYRSGQFPFTANARAKCLGTTDGMVKILADAKTDRLLGFHIIGPTASEMIAEAVIAFEFGASAEDIARSVHAHPTLAEVMKEAALAVDKRTIHI